MANISSREFKTTRPTPGDLLFHRGLNETKYSDSVSEGLDDGHEDGVIAIIMANDELLENRTVDFIREMIGKSYSHFRSLQIESFDLDRIRSHDLWTDGLKRGYVISTFSESAPEVIEGVQDHDVAVLIWEQVSEDTQPKVLTPYTQPLFEDVTVREMFVRSGGAIRWRGKANGSNVSSAIYEFAASIRRAGNDRIAEVQRWRGAAESLLFELECVLEARSQLLAELEDAKVDLRVANARIDQLESLTSFLRAELYRTLGQDHPHRVGLVASLVIAVVAAITGATTGAVATSHLEPLQNQAHKTVIVCEAPALPDRP